MKTPNVGRTSMRWVMLLIFLVSGCVARTGSYKEDLEKSGHKHIDAAVLVSKLKGKTFELSYDGRAIDFCADRSCYSQVYVYRNSNHLSSVFFGEHWRANFEFSDGRMCFRDLTSEVSGYEKGCFWFLAPDGIAERQTLSGTIWMYNSSGQLHGVISSVRNGAVFIPPTIPLLGYSERKRLYEDHAQKAEAYDRADGEA